MFLVAVVLYHERDASTSKARTRKSTAGGAQSGPLYSTVFFFEPSVTLRILRKVIDTRSPLTAGTVLRDVGAVAVQHEDRADGERHADGRVEDAVLDDLDLFAEGIGCSESSESVTNGRTKSWWSMCGGMQSPSSTRGRQSHVRIIAPNCAELRQRCAARTG